MRSRINFAVLASTMALLSFSLLAYSRLKEIEPSSPKYLPRTSKEFEDVGRIVGELKRPPATFTIEVRRSTMGDPILTEEHKGYLTIYETGVLAPGKYFVKIKAEGYQDQLIKSLEIKAGYDCIINISFGTIAYDKG